MTYDLPGFGESDPYPGRNLSSSAFDILHLADAVGVSDKFWVLGYSGAAMHVWASLKYIPHRVAGTSNVYQILTICIFVVFYRKFQIKHYHYCHYDFAGAAFVAPMINPYEPSMNKEEKYGTWAKYGWRRKFVYFLARRFPYLLSILYQRKFLLGEHGRIDDWLSLSMGQKVNVASSYM